MKACYLLRESEFTDILTPFFVIYTLFWARDKRNSRHAIAEYYLLEHKATVTPTEKSAT